MIAPTFSTIHRIRRIPIAIDTLHTRTPCHSIGSRRTALFPLFRGRKRTPTAADKDERRNYGKENDHALPHCNIPVFCFKKYCVRDTKSLHCLFLSVLHSSYKETDSPLKL